MIEKFLKAKHWQLFILGVGIPLLFQIILMTTMVSNIHSNTISNPTEIFSMMKFLPIVFIISILTLFGWFWSIAMGLQKKNTGRIKNENHKI